MAITGLTVAEGATVSSTGGTNVPVSEKARGLSSLLMAASNDLLGVQRRWNFSVSEPRIDKNNPTGFTQARRTLVITIPRDIGDGVINVDKVTVEIATGLNTPVADLNDYRNFIAQSVTDGDLDDFWQKLLLA